MTTVAPPPEAPPTVASPPPLTPGARTAVRALLVVAATVLLVGAVAALGVTAFGLSTFRVLADEKSVPGDIRSLTIDTGEVPAAVTLRTDREATEVRVSLRVAASTRTGDQTLTVDRGPSGATVTVSGEAPEFLNRMRTGRIIVTMPPTVARNLSVTVRQQTGVLFADAYVDELIAHGSDGAVVLNAGARRIEVHNTDGSVVSRSPISVTESFTAEVGDGDIVIGFADAAPEVVKATTNNGDIALEVPATGPYLLRVASGGSTTVRVPETDDPAVAVSDITARSDDGAVSVTTLGDGFGERRHR